MAPSDFIHKCILNCQVGMATDLYSEEGLFCKLPWKRCINVIDTRDTILRDFVPVVVNCRTELSAISVKGQELMLSVYIIHAVWQ